MFCSGCNNLYVKAYKNISECRSCLFAFEGEDCFATFTSGKREDPFLYDGINNELVSYGVLLVKYKSQFDVNILPNFVLLIDSMQYSGKLEYNPIDSTFVVDIKKEATQNSDIYLRLWGGGVNEQSHMKCLSNAFIGYKEALKIAVFNIKDMGNSSKDLKNLRGEFFIKFVGEESLVNINYYVQFITKDKETIIFIIDAYSGDLKLTKHLQIP